MKKKFSRDRLKKNIDTTSPENASHPQTGINGETEQDSPRNFEEDFIENSIEENALSPIPNLAKNSTEIEALTEHFPGLVVVSKAEEGLRLDKVMALHHPEYSRSQLSRLAKEGLVLLDQRPVKASTLVSAGQTISFPPPAPPRTDLEPEPDVIINVLYEDEHILALDKPWGLAVHPAPGYHGPTLVGGLLARDPKLKALGERFRPGLVHRLDRNTSGVMITAKTEVALKALGEAFSNRQAHKGYLAFVRGRLPLRAATIDQPLGRHPSLRHKMAVTPNKGRPARTFYRVLAYFPTTGVSLVWLNLITGRTHQARVHLQNLATPVLADPVYSRGTAELTKAFPQLAPYLERQLLHARRLTLAHPRTGEAMTFRAPWPPEFRCLLKELLKIERGRVD